MKIRQCTAKCQQHREQAEIEMDRKDGIVDVPQAAAPRDSQPTAKVNKSTKKLNAARRARMRDISATSFRHRPSARWLPAILLARVFVRKPKADRPIVRRMTKKAVPPRQPICASCNDSVSASRLPAERDRILVSLLSGAIIECTSVSRESWIEKTIHDPRSDERVRGGHGRS